MPDRHRTPRICIRRRPFELAFPNCPARELEARPVRSRTALAVGPSILVLPSLAGAVRVDIAERVDHDAVEEELDRIVPIDVHRFRGARRCKTEELHEFIRLFADVNEGASGKVGGPKDLRIVPVSVFEDVEAIPAQVGNVARCIKLDALW